MLKNTRTKKTLLQQSYLFQGNNADEASDAGDVGVVQAQQGENGVGLQENSRGGWTKVSETLTAVDTQR